MLIKCVKYTSITRKLLDKMVLQQYLKSNTQIALHAAEIKHLHMDYHQFIRNTETIHLICQKFKD